MQSITIRGKDYPIKITTRAAVEMEEKLGYNPINLFVRIDRDEELPSLKDLLIILHYSLLKLNHGISYNDTVNLFDDYCDENGSIVTLLKTLYEAFKESGIIKIEEDPNL